MDLKEAGIEDEVIEILKKNEITTIEELAYGTRFIVGLGPRRQIKTLYKALIFMHNKNKPIKKSKVNWDRRAQALNLQNSGHTYKQIAVIMNIKPARVGEILKAAKRRQWGEAQNGNVWP